MSKKEKNNINFAICILGAAVGLMIPLLSKGLESNHQLAEENIKLQLELNELQTRLDED